MLNVKLELLASAHWQFFIRDNESQFSQRGFKFLSTTEMFTGATSCKVVQTTANNAVDAEDHNGMVHTRRCGVLFGCAAAVPLYAELTQN